MIFFKRFTLLFFLLSLVTYSFGQEGCQSAKEWSSKLVYETEGAQVVYKGKLYTSKWFTKNDVPGENLNGPWKFLSFCNGSTADCSKATPYSPTKTYQQAGMNVVYNDNIYENLWFAKGKNPENSEVWVFKGPCSAGAKNPMAKASSGSSAKGIVATPYPYGTMPTNANMAEVKKAYDAWKVKYITSSGCPEGTKRVLFDDMKSTVSEGVAYGLICAGYMKDQELFDDIYGYYTSYLDPWGLMHWKIDENGVRAGDNAATDADEDVAFMLLIAHENFGSDGDINYMAEAKKIIDLMMESMVEKETYVLKPGDAWGGSLNTNPCYYVPAYYKIFAKVSGDNDWVKVADKCYDIIFAAWNETTGLVPDWCQADGSLPAMNEGKPLEWAKNLGKTYYYDATRTPWRIGMDYFWYGDKRAEKYNKSITNFINSIGGFSKVTDGYNLDGTPFSFNKTSAFVGPFAVGVMATGGADQALVNKGWDENVNTFNDVYYNDMVRLMMMIVQTGLYNIPDKYAGL